ncbi:MAG: hypothetical protein IJ180_07655 [Bacteroidales bacterium]|nr:hypothetical protein [Bacteroidales bacterium]
MADTDKIIMFPDGNNGGGFFGGNNGWGGGLLGFLLGAMFGNGGFFGNGMWGMNGMFGGNLGSIAGTGYLANMMNNDSVKESILNAINGTDADVRLLATTLNADVNQVREALNTINTAILKVGADNNLNYAQTINAVQSGNASLSKQLCECCCENRLAIANQTNTLQAQAAANHAAQQMETCQQTNQLGSQADRNTATIMNRIADLDTKVTREFCDIREREMQSKIDTQGDIITQLRGQLDNDRQTAQLYNAIAPIQAKVNEIANKQPNTVPVQYPNITAVNNTPYMGGFYGWNNGWNQNFWN